jgi:RNA polymerase sigma-70 factor, ECF subfamily
LNLPRRGPGLLPPGPAARHNIPMPEPLPISDEDLMARVQAGEAPRFGELAARYRGALLRLAESRLASRTLAEDAVQETLLAAFKSRHTYNRHYTLRTWLWTILLNQCRTVWQRQKRRPQVQAWSQGEDAGPGEWLPAETAGNEPPPDVNLLAEERREQLERLLAGLSAEQGDALRLRFFGGLKFHEIADAMGCSLGTAKNRVRWGLEKMSAALRSSPDKTPALPIDHDGLPDDLNR